MASSPSADASVLNAPCAHRADLLLLPGAGRRHSSKIEEQTLSHAISMTGHHGCASSGTWPGARATSLSPEGIRVCPATRRLRNFRASAVHIDRLTGELSRAELNRGDKAPAFSLPDQDGKQVALPAHRGWKRLFFLSQSGHSGLRHAGLQHPGCHARTQEPGGPAAGRVRRVIAVDSRRTSIIILSR